jgi:hypothetical protein
MSIRQLALLVRPDDVGDFLAVDINGQVAGSGPGLAALMG